MQDQVSATLLVVQSISSTIMLRTVAVQSKSRVTTKNKQSHTSMPERMGAGISAKSFKFLSGSITLLMPYRCAAST